jgi:hypothetical protein
MKTRLVLCLTFCAALAGIVRADVVVPNALAATEGDGVFNLTSTAAAGRTFQMTIEAGQLAGIVGQEITGWQWRLNNTATVAWPTANASFATFNVFIGEGVDPSAMTTTFASNFLAGSTQVRAGGLNINASAYPIGGGGTVPNAFGPAILFDTPWLYTGGDLAIEFRFSQQLGATTQSPFDGVTASLGPGNGWGVGFSARWTGNIAGTTGGNGNFLVTNFLTQSVVPEPATGSMFCLLLAGLITRRCRDHG